MTLRIYSPEKSGNTDTPALVWFHGGGFVLGSLETADPTCRELVNRAGCTVVSVGYRLAPEHPFPAAVEDAYAATQWVEEKSDEIGISDKLAVGGDSAGGNLAAVVTHIARDQKVLDDRKVDISLTSLEGDAPSIDYQVLVYPAVNYLEPMDSYEENGEGYFLSFDEMAWFLHNYIDNPIHGRNPYAFPLQAQNFENLPPATVITSGFDPLRDEGEEYVECLLDAGVEVEHSSYDDTIHGFFSMTFIGIERADEAVEEVSDSLKKEFGL
ncbi:MAG: alpha/beta hydrolase [Halobacteria archaeon]|nr:alpha/beta hydrolase [Halobacteria archaeon]